MFHSKDSLFFTCNEDGSVTITKTDGKPASDGGHTLFEQTLDAGTWVSAVLTMSAFDERSGDFHVWMRHHQGEEDLLKPKGQIITHNDGTRSVVAPYRGQHPAREDTGVPIPDPHKGE